MKILMVHPGPDFAVADVFNGLCKGLEQNGCNVGVLNLGDRLEFYAQARIEQRDGTFGQAMSKEAAYMMAAKGIETVAYEWWPDVIVIMSGWFIPPEVWGVFAMRPHHVVYWCTESPYEDDRQAQPARYTDTVILNDPTNVDGYRRDVNPNTHYLWHSFDPDVHCPGPSVPDLRCDFGWVGTGFPSRMDFFEAVDWSGIDAKFGGNWRWLQDDSPLLPFLANRRDQSMVNSTTVDLYRSAKVSANLYRKEHSESANAEGWAMGPREVELAATGTFFLREPRPEGDEVFPMLPVFTDTDEFEEQLRWWLKRPDLRERRAKEARAAVADRTFKNTAARLLKIIERSPARKFAG